MAIGAFALRAWPIQEPSGARTNVRPGVSLAVSTNAVASDGKLVDIDLDGIAALGRPGSFPQV